MRALCGWLSFASRPESVLRATLDSLLASRGHASSAVDAVVTANGGLAGVGTDLDVAQRDDAVAAILGRPIFRDGGPSGHSADKVARLWRQHGRDLPKHLGGSFALAIVEPAERSVFLAIDRIGFLSLAFAVCPDGVAFSNRADLVSAHPSVASEIDLQGVFNYIYFSMVPAPGTIFRGVEKLLPAQWVHFRDGSVERGFYWRLRYRDARRRDFPEQSAYFRQLLRESVARAKGDDDVAAFLSGGTDSSTVAGVLTELQGRPARTYSIGFEAEGFDEMEYARIAARHFGLDAREYYLRPDDVVAAIPLIAEHYDEPFANESAVSAYFCAKLAADDGYRVMLGGDGGDEIFGGNARYAKQRLFEAYGRIPAFLRHSLIEPTTQWRGMDRWWLGRKLQSYVRQARIALPERMESYNLIYRQPLSEMFEPGLLAEIDATLPALWLKEVYARADTSHYINRMLHLDLKFTLADNDLRKVSTMAEAAGVEVRYPLLDDTMVELSGEVPPNWKVKGQYLRWFFKTALKGYLPDAILEKAKHGFGLPFGLWALDHAPLRERVADALTDFKRRGWLQSAYIERLQQEHATEHATYFGRMLWVILIMEEWLRARKGGQA